MPWKYHSVNQYQTRLVIETAFRCLENFNCPLFYSWTTSFYSWTALFYPWTTLFHSWTVCSILGLPCSIPELFCSLLGSLCSIPKLLCSITELPPLSTSTLNYPLQPHYSECQSVCWSDISLSVSLYFNLSVSLSAC